VARRLFGLSGAIGQDVKVNDLWLTVVGVLAAETSGGPALPGGGGGATTGEIYVPWTTALRKLDRDPLDAPLAEIILALKPGASAREQAALVPPLLDRLHGGAADFELVVPERLLAQSQRTQRLFNVVMGAIAGISLLVGGIGIMNIMLATVLERTREIGIRRAVGARRADIRFQFVAEAFALSLTGGLAGIVMGLVISRVVAVAAGWPTVVTWWSLALSTGVSAAVGLASGIYPALRAADLHPIDALRYE
jgi:putative ABC transport system permease protein